ncbi:hypothetical protein COLO4_04182 [Corchorus olitorius]|uniref:Uncharacterized protein n=1 Tax=Corchorus olitorius TaxID=93759 RepID=A0A1R3KUY1_9ROSI|nr:hypothetical protein COLO4_04182 [Corchorus olitorius]
MPTVEDEEAWPIGDTLGAELYKEYPGLKKDFMTRNKMIGKMTQQEHLSTKPDTQVQLVMGSRLSEPVDYPRLRTVRSTFIRLGKGLSHRKGIKASNRRRYSEYKGLVATESLNRPIALTAYSDYEDEEDLSSVYFVLVPLVNNTRLLRKGRWTLRKASQAFETVLRFGLSTLPSYSDPLSLTYFVPSWERSRNERGSGRKSYILYQLWVKFKTGQDFLYFVTYLVRAARLCLIAVQGELESAIEGDIDSGSYSVE